MRNFLLRGPAGTGKTMGAKAIAAGLGLPYMKYTCSAGTEIYDFVGMVFPNTEHSTGDAQLDQEREQLRSLGGMTYENVSKLLHLPDLEDMDYDPAGVYQSLTGVENQAATAQDCMALVLEKVTEKVRAAQRRTCRNFGSNLHLCGDGLYQGVEERLCRRNSGAFHPFCSPACWWASTPCWSRRGPSPCPPGR